MWRGREGGLGWDGGGGFGGEVRDGKGLAGSGRLDGV